MPASSNSNHIFVAFAVLAAGNVGVRQFVHDYRLRMPRNNRVHIHLFQVHAAVGNHFLRDDLEVPDLFLGFLPSVGLHQADDDIFAALRSHQVGIVQHLVGFAHARRSAQVDAQLGGLRLALKNDLGHRSAHLDWMMHFTRYSNWNCKSECRAVAQAALHGNLAAERLHQPPNQRKAESCPLF